MNESERGELKQEFSEWLSQRRKRLPHANPTSFGEEALAFEVWESLSAPRAAEASAIADFFRRYNNAIDNPAPDGDGCTTSYEYEKLLEEAAELLEKLT